MIRRVLLRFMRSSAWLNHVGPIVNIFRLFGGYAPVVLLQNGYYFARRVPLLHRYRWCGDEAIRERKRSDTIFVFGSGASLNEISPQEWERIRRHNSVGCNYFVHQRFIDLDFQTFDTLEKCGGLLRVEAIQKGRPKAPIGKFLHEARRYGQIVAGNPRLRDTIFLIPTEFLAKSAVMLLSGPFLPRGLRIRAINMSYNGFNMAGVRSGPPASPGSRLPGGLYGAIAFAAVYGWKNIVLIGVDLYDSRYFFLPRDKTRNYHGDPDALQPKARARVRLLKSWADELDRRGQKVLVYNPRSLLAGEIELFDWRLLRDEAEEVRGMKAGQDC